MHLRSPPPPPPLKAWARVYSQAGVFDYGNARESQPVYRVCITVVHMRACIWRGLERDMSAVFAAVAGRPSSTDAPTGRKHTVPHSVRDTACLGQIIMVRACVCVCMCPTTHAHTHSSSRAFRGELIVAQPRFVRYPIHILCTHGALCIFLRKL